MPRATNRARSLLARAAMHALYANKEGDGAGAPPAPKPNDPPAPPKPSDPPQPKKIELTEDELNARIFAAAEAERKRLADERQREKEEAERKKAEEQGEYQKIAKQEEEKRTAAEQKAAAAERRAQLAEVNIALRDHLAGDDARRAYLNNAPDIMLHVEKALAADAKPEDVAKLIEKETAAFIQRTGAAQGTRGTGGPGANRGKLPAGMQLPPARNENNNRRPVGPAARF